jgi:hypothetical protein
MKDRAYRTEQPGPRTSKLKSTEQNNRRKEHMETRAYRTEQPVLEYER